MYDSRSRCPCVSSPSLLFFESPSTLYASAQSNSGGLADRVAELEAQLEELSAILEFVYVEAEVINGLAGPHWIIEGANVHVRSGSGSTNSGLCPVSHSGCGLGAGLGNLVVGYNEGTTSQPRSRRGMHNLVVGPEHEYAGSGGFVAGSHNSIRGPGASVTGGKNNKASGQFSSVSGGHRNLASGSFSSVGGGQDRVAPGEFNWAAGNLLEPN